MSEEGVFTHYCGFPGCKFLVQYDDEPFCFDHSPDSGSNVQGYSARTIVLNCSAEDIVGVLITELSKWGHGDMHYGVQRQDSSVAMTVGMAKAWLEANKTPVDTKPEEGVSVLLKGFPFVCECTHAGFTLNKELLVLECVICDRYYSKETGKLLGQGERKVDAT